MHGFQRLIALKCLSVPFSLLMGKSMSPDADGESLQHLHLRDVLPPQLEHLKLDISCSMISHEHQDCLTVMLTSALPLHQTHSHLKVSMEGSQENHVCIRVVGGQVYIRVRTKNKAGTLLSLKRK
jgi:hypothetical protein